MFLDRIKFRTVLHQLRQREPAAILRSAHFQVGTRGIQSGEYQLAAHRIRRQSRLA